MIKPRILRTLPVRLLPIARQGDQQFQPYTMVNDHRTELKITDVQKVMDGAIDPFIEAYLKQLYGGAKA